MKTTKAISTISYNTTAFLHGTLKRLVSEGILTFWVFIQHQPEEDETKEHFHVFMKPNKAVDTLWLQNQFIEQVAGEKLPRKCLPIDPSKFADWYWYGLHDATYLAGKGMSRKRHYDGSEMVASDSDYLTELVRINPCPETEMVKVLKLIRQGCSVVEIALALKVPMARFSAFQHSVYDMLRLINCDDTFRAGRDAHEQDFEALIEEKKDNEN